MNSIREDLIGSAGNLLWECRTRTMCRPEHLEEFKQKAEDFEAACKTAGLSSSELYAEAEQKMRDGEKA